ncbi:MAG TPA: flagellar motor protein [Acidimicrobiales bacterium]|nr:flagellar motor protein [Acidimicrobiales bacterium]
MDPGTLVGVVLALAAIFGSMVMEGGNPAAIIAPPAMILVLVGTMGVALASGLLKDFKTIPSLLKTALLAKPHEADDTIKQVVKFAETARREGLLALEEAARSIEDPFLKKGIEMAVDGTDPEELREILESDVAAMRSRHKAGAKFFTDMGAYAPTLGIIGTVLGLVHVLENLSDPSKLGHLIAGAFIATLWGVMSANVIWLPIGSKLKRVSEIEVHHRELVLEGIMSIQAGANPRVIEQKLLAYVPPKARAAMAENKGKAA